MASIVVVGGGLAGLTCAWRLLRAGHQVEVLEASDQPGGHLGVVDADEPEIDTGESFDERFDVNTLRLAQQLDVGGVRQPVSAGAPHARDRADVAVLRDGRLYGERGRGLVGYLATSLLPLGARLGLASYGARALLWGRRLRMARAEWVQRLDTTSYAEDALRFAGRDAAQLVLGPVAEAATSCPRHERSRAFALEAGLRWWLPGRPIAFARGGRELVDALAARVRVRRECEVVAVESETDGARVRYRVRGDERNALADAVVVAVSAAHVSRVCAKLTPDEAGFFESVRYAPRLGVHLVLAPLPAPLLNRRFVLPRREGHASISIRIGRLRADDEGQRTTVLTLWSSPAVVEDDLRASDGALVERALRDLSRTPIGRIAVRDARVSRRPNAVPLFSVGHPTRVERFVDRIDRTPRVAFAGDYLVAPDVEGGVTSGMRAATRIAREFAAARTEGSAALRC